MKYVRVLKVGPPLALACSSISSWLIMPVSADKSSRLSSTQRRKDLSIAVELIGRVAMVACLNCARSGEPCFFAKEKSKKCSCCIRKNMECDGSFSLEELRSTVEQKKDFQERSRRKRKEIARLRRALADVESEDNNLQESIAKLEELSSNMVRHEMQALGVLDEQPSQDLGAFAEPAFPWQDIPFNQTVDLDFLSCGASAVGGLDASSSRLEQVVQSQVLPLVPMCLLHADSLSSVPDSESRL